MQTPKISTAARYQLGSMFVAAAFATANPKENRPAFYPHSIMQHEQYSELVGAGLLETETATPHNSPAYWLTSLAYETPATFPLYA